MKLTIGDHKFRTESHGNNDGKCGRVKNFSASVVWTSTVLIAARPHRLKMGHETRKSVVLGLL